ncbi:hypothetical protein J6S88_03450 [bacterium]|nr:hypothetical protein [bacterium]
MVKISGIQSPQIHFAKNPFKHAEKPEENTPAEIKFGKSAAVNVANEEGEKKKFGFKKLTNILGTALGIGIICVSAISLARRPKWMKLQGKQKGLEAKINAAANRFNDAVEINTGKQKKGNFLYRLGHKTNAIVDRVGEELSNNLLYGIGTVIVMPLVILFSPFGKKNSSKEDKKYAVYRQPLSFATMFSIQLTNDKMFKRWTNAIMDQNLLETDAVKNAIKEGNAESVVDDIKYADGTLKKIFESFADNVLGDAKLSAEEKGILYKMKNAEMQHTQLEEFLKDTAKRSVSEENIKNILKHFDRYTKAAGNKRLVGESLKIVSNVLISQFVGCTLLNVIYGKMMKHNEIKKQDKLAHEQMKEKIAALEAANNSDGRVA